MSLFFIIDLCLFKVWEIMVNLCVLFVGFDNERVV